MDQLETLKQLEHSLGNVFKQGRETLEVGSFEVYLSASDDFFLNAALPKLNPTDWSDSVIAMCDAFVSRGRRPRLEFFHELHPELAGALKHAGFTQDMSAPVMTLRKADLSKAPVVQQGHYKRLHLEADLETHLRKQSLAYGGSGDDSALVWLPNLLKGMANETVMVAALEVEGEFDSGASIQIGGDIGELAGVWTLPEQQKQGFAFELCWTLLTDYFVAGYSLCWLSAAEGALRLYEKLGFKRVGTQLNYSLSE